MSWPGMNGVIIYRGEVRSEWIDVNDHMNVAYYVLALDLAIDALWDQFGITDEYMATTRGSTFAVESHVTYQNELLEGDRYIVTAQILGFDEKRIHQFQRIYHEEKRYLAATAEWMNLHVDLDSRRVSPWPEEIQEKIRQFSIAQADRTWPEAVGRQMAIKKPLFTLLANSNDE
jgi:acyl-CoA thioester hydrolase